MFLREEALLAVSGADEVLKTLVVAPWPVAGGVRRFRYGSTKERYN